MPGASTVKAGRAWWEITAEDKASKVIEAVSERLESMGRTTMVAGAAIAAAGAAIVGPVLAAASSWANYASDLEKASIRTGVSVESLSTLSLVAEDTGASTEALNKGLIGVAKFAKAVAAGSSEATDALNQMGLSASTFLAASPDERVKLLADGLASVADPSKRATLAMTAFSELGIDLLPMLSQGGDAIQRMQQGFADLGLAVPSQDLGLFVAWGDSMAILGKQFTRIWHEAGAALIEMTTPLMDPLKQALAMMIEFAQANRGLVKIIVAVGAALATVGTAVFGVGAALATAGAIISGIGSALIAIGPIVAAISAAFTFLAGPVGLAILAVAAVVAVVTALGVAFVQLTDTGARAWSALTRGIMGVWQRFREVIGGIANALLAGEWGLAVNIAWAGVMLVFEHNLAVLSKGFWSIAETLGDSILWGLSKVEAAFEAVFGPVGIIAAAQDKLRLFADEQRAAADAGVAAQRAELDKLIAEADAARARTKQRFDFSRSTTGGDISQTTAAGGATAAQQQAGILGTFSATVAGMLGDMRPDVMETIATNTGKAAETLDRIEDKMAEGGLEFE